MRLFAGIPVPDPARQELASVLDGLRSKNWPVRWVRPEGLHLTLKFFGSVEDGVVESLGTALATAAEGTGPIPLTCTGIGGFPNPRRARVVWIGLEAPGSLELLQDAVERACANQGFPLEGKPYRPHITLGRVRDGERLPPDAWSDLPARYGIRFLAEELVLFQSQPGRDGSVYSARRTIPLGPCAVV
jgi:RNA 2',3'-cyclic 3'-phosphodiesterase